jgi:hypothetical protein
MDELNNMPGYTYHLQVKDHKLVIDEDNTVDFKYGNDLRGELVSALGFVLDEYDLDLLIEGQIPSITIVISPADWEDEDFDQ